MKFGELAVGTSDTQGRYNGLGGTQGKNDPTRCTPELLVPTEIRRAALCRSSRDATNVVRSGVQSDPFQTRSVQGTELRLFGDETSDLQSNSVQPARNVCGE